MRIGRRFSVRTAGAAAAMALTLALAACGSASKHSASSGSTSSTTTTTATAPGSDLAASEQPSAAQFPASAGKTLQEIANLATQQVQLGPATGVFTPGRRRVAFGLNTSTGAFVYGPTAIYLAPAPGARAAGPFLAPADPMTVSPQFRSQQNAGPGGIQAIYAATVPVAHPGTYAILALTHLGGALVGATGEIAVASSSPIPDVGQRPPAIATDTPASVGGRVGLLTTRVPPDDMHAVSFASVLGKAPVALLFSTPQLCMSRVCGPVTDIAAELEQQFGRRVTFIHEEVYVNNDPKQGLRPQLKDFHLQTEPWLFTITRGGLIAARLEGAFGVNEFRNAVEAALR